MLKLDNFLVHLKPYRYYESILDIDFAELHKLGFKFYIIDVDNTIADRKSDRVAQAILEKITEARSQGFIKKICLLSNVGIKNLKREERIQKIAQQLGTANFICASWPDIKPNPVPFWQALDLMAAKIEETVVIGDQIFSDISGGNKLGMYTILVKPMGSDHPITYWKRLLEKIVIKYLKITPTHPPINWGRRKI